MDTIHHTAVKGRKPRSIKTFNRQQILKIIKQKQVCTAVDISSAVGLSLTSVNLALKDLLSAGIIETAGKGQPGREGGKRPDLYRLNPHYAYCVVCCASETSIVLTVYDFTMQRIVDATRVEPEFTDGHDFVPEIARAVTELLEKNELPQEKLKAIGIVLWAIVDSDRGIAQYPEDSPFHVDYIHYKDNLQPYFPDSGIYVNSAGRFALYAALSEREELADKKVFMIGGSEDSIGGAEINQMRITKGRHGLAGEIGHLWLPIATVSGDRIRGAAVAPEIRELNEFLNEKNMMLVAKEMARANPEGSTEADILEDKLQIRDLGKLADEGDQFAREVITRIADTMLLVINHTMLFSDPDVIALAGYYADFGSFYKQYLESRINSASFTGMEIPVQLVFFPLSGEDTINGAAEFALDEITGSVETD